MFCRHWRQYSRYICWVCFANIFYVFMAHLCHLLVLSVTLKGVLSSTVMWIFLHTLVLYFACIFWSNTVWWIQISNYYIFLVNWTFIILKYPSLVLCPALKSAWPDINLTTRPFGYSVSVIGLFPSLYLNLCIILYNLHVIFRWISCKQHRIGVCACACTSFNSAWQFLVF